MPGEISALMVAAELSPQLLDSAGASSRLLEELAGASKAGMHSFDFERVAPSLLKVNNLTTGGTGFVFDNQLVATADHVVGNPATNTVYEGQGIQFSGGPRLPARVVLRSPNEDLAILHVPDLGSNAPKLELSSANHLLTDGDPLHIVGYDVRTHAIEARHGTFMENVFAKGPFSGLNHFAVWIRSAMPDVIPGYSGGPLIGESGTVHGILARSTGEVTDAVDVRHLLFARNELKNGLPESGWIRYGSKLAINKDGTGGSFQRLFSRLRA